MGAKTMHRLFAVVAATAVTGVIAVSVLASAPKVSPVAQQQTNPFEMFDYFQSFPNTLESAGVLLNYLTLCRASAFPREHKLFLTLGFMSKKYGEENVKDAATEVLRQQLQRGIFDTYCKRVTVILDNNGS
jgi:hypothetical protein